MSYSIWKIIILFGLLAIGFLFFARKKSAQNQSYKGIRLFGIIFLSLAVLLMLWWLSIVLFLEMNDGIGFT